MGSTLLLEKRRRIGTTGKPDHPTVDGSVGIELPTGTKEFYSPGGDRRKRCRDEGRGPLQRQRPVGIPGFSQRTISTFFPVTITETGRPSRVAALHRCA